MCRPLCLPDDDDLTVDLPAERIGTAMGWGLQKIERYKNTGCNFVQGVVSDTDSLPSKLKKIELK